MTRGSRLLLVPVALAQCLFFIFIARHRFANGDEGFYLLASRLILMHKTPYVDFSYVQAPLLPYVYAAWMKVTSLSWASARLLSALITTVLGTLVYEEVCHQTGRWLAGLTAVVLFAFSTLVFACFPAVHTFSLSALLLFAAYMVVERSSKGFSSWPMGLAGILIGLSVDTRSYLILTLPVFLWWILRNSQIRAKSTMPWFIGGLAAGLLPCLYLFLVSPGAFWFNNLGYHAMRSDAGLVGSWLEKLTVLLMFFLGGPQGNGIQNSILFFASISFVFSTRELKGAPGLAFQIGVFLGLVSLLPTPVYPGYFSLCIPFLVVSAVCAGTDLLFSPPSRGGRLVVACATVTLLAVYLAAAVPDLRNYLVTGEGIASVGSAHDKSDWRLENIVEVSRAIDQVAAPGEAVASLWPGYIFQTHAVPWPGLENDFVLPVADKMTARQRQRYHVSSLAEIESSLSGRVPRIVVLGNQNKLAAKATGDLIIAALKSQRYDRVRTIGDTSIYACCSKP
jgi:hypothetical protein